MTHDPWFPPMNSLIYKIFTTFWAKLTQGKLPLTLIDYSPDNVVLFDWPLRVR